MNWKRVVESLEQAAEDRQNRANMAAVRGGEEGRRDARAMGETSHLLGELAYALRLGLEAAE